MGKQFRNITVSILLGLGAVLAGTNIPITTKEIPKSVRIEKKSGTLEDLARNGLPQELLDIGFKVGTYTNKRTEKEIIILAENSHGSKEILEKKKELFLYLGKNYGTESIGLEGYAGEYPNIKSDNGIGSPWNDEDLNDLRSFLVNNKIDLTYYGLENHDVSKLLGIDSFNILLGISPSKEEIINKVRNAKGRKVDVELLASTKRTR